MRASGILLHITSLPSEFGIGDLGPSSYQFADFLTAGKQHFWQILPLNPSGSFVGNSPYAAYSAFAGNPLLISPDFLRQEGFITDDDLLDHPVFPAERVDFRSVIPFKIKILEKAFRTFQSRSAVDKTFQDFIQLNADWLDDYALFVALKQHFEEKSWKEWPEDLRNRVPEALEHIRVELKDKVMQAQFLQYLFYKQWMALKDYCTSKGIEIIGDVPIYVSYDSPDVWAHPELFKLDTDKNPIYVSGAPPDYYSETGQLWGSPVYDWDNLRKTKFSWWVRRIEHNLFLYHRIRLDHFRGFVAYWEIPASEETAVNGKWVKVPVKEFFDTILERFPNLPIIAEDLGLITPDVKEILDQYKFPGMKVLLFAFGPDLPTNPYIPHNYIRDCFVYTGTHDNNTVQGWFHKEATSEERKRCLDYLGFSEPVKDLHWHLIRVAYSSIADSAVIPIQDILGLGEEARMNRPDKQEGNWTWRALQEQVNPSLAQTLSHLSWMYGRTS